MPSWEELPTFLHTLLADPNLPIVAAPSLLSLFVVIILVRRLTTRKDSASEAITSPAITSPDDAEPAPLSATEPPSSSETSTALVRRGLTKSRTNFFSRLQAIFSGESKERRQILESLEELLISADLGVKTTGRLIAAAESAISSKSSEFEQADQLQTGLMSALKSEIAAILSDSRSAEIDPSSNRPFVILVVGVNGVGKTTTVGKLAARLGGAANRVLLGACDTFRAAAHQQLDVWAERAGAEIVAGEDGEKPSTVAYRTIERAKSGDFDVVLIDTAGRLHTRVPLMNELKAVQALITRELPGAPHETILVLDATTGQNALQQAKDFNSAVPLTGVVITKLDGSPKGGIVVAIKAELGVPIRYIGVGERLEDLLPFSPDDFVEGLFTGDSTSAPSLNRVSRKRRLNEVSAG